MDKIAIPVAVVLAIVAYVLIGEQFKKIKEAPPAAVQQAAIQTAPELKALQIPQFQLQPFQLNPFAKQGPPPEPAADNFNPISYDDPGKKYRVTFPGRPPTRVSFPLITVKVNRCTVPKPNMMFEVDDYDSGWDAAQRRVSARAWLTKCHKLQLEAMHASEDSSKEIAFNDAIPGIEFEALYLKDDKTQVWVGRSYLVGSHLYTVSVYGDPGVVPVRAPAFIQSFDLAPKPAKTTPTPRFPENVD